MAALGHPAGLAAPELAFAATGARRVERTAQPTLAIGLRITTADPRPIRSIVLDTQVQIAARRRAYGAAEQERLFELFGHARDWGTTLRTLLWARLTTTVPPFSGSADVELHLPCSYDLEVLGARYLDALGEGTVPLELCFSGTVFWTAEGGLLQAGRIPWDREAELDLPVATWRETLDHHFRGDGWLRLRKDAIDRLAAFRARHAHATWEEALDALLPPGPEAL